MQLTACSKRGIREIQGLAAGTVHIAIFQPNNRLSLDQVTFEIKLPMGVVEQVHDFRYDTNKTVEPRSGSNAVANSPNNGYTAGFRVGDHRFVGYPRDVFFVRDLATGHIVFQAQFRYEEIEGFVWDPRSEAVAALTSSQHYSVNPKYWLNVLTGHPRPVEKYRLEIVAVRTHSSWGIDLPYESSAGFGKITGWSQP
jgi:hypothetical protein